MNRNTKYLAGLVVIILIGIAVLTLRDEGNPSLSSVEEWEATLDLLIPDNGYGSCGFVTISFPENVSISPRDKLDEILGNFGESGQYVPGSNPVENSKENGRLTYRYEFGLIPTSPDIPPIRQDNENTRFCFYVWRQIIHPHPKENGKLIVILPEGYELENVSGRPEHWSSDISATAAEFLENRWRVTAWSDPYGELFLRVDYRKV